MFPQHDRRVVLHTAADSLLQFRGIPKTNALWLLAPRSLLLLHLVEQRCYTSAQRPLAVFAYEVVIWRIFDDFLRYFSAFALPSAVAGQSLVFGVVATAWVEPRWNRAHCVLMGVEFLPGIIS